MTRQCKCGGTFRRTDIVPKYDPRYKRVMYHDADNFKANWRCDGCGTVRTQRKRQPKLSGTQTTWPPPPGMVVFSPDCRDGSKDRLMPRAEARKLYEEGKIAIDLTNSKPDRIVYCPLGEIE